MRLIKVHIMIPTRFQSKTLSSYMVSSSLIWGHYFASHRSWFRITCCKNSIPIWFIL